MPEGETKRALRRVLLKRSTQASSKGVDQDQDPESKARKRQRKLDKKLKAAAAA